jgi:hypothetical protein
MDIAVSSGSTTSSNYRKLIEVGNSTAAGPSHGILDFFKIGLL